jgi:putative oxidoreductase
MRNRPIYDVVALLARCGVGTVFVAHGWQKIQVGINATGRNLDAMGAPAPTASAVYSTFVELLGGAALILGLALPVAGTLLFLDMAGALVFIHAKHGIFLVDSGKVSNGFELVLVLGFAALLFAAGGGGRLALDHRLFGPGRTRRRNTDSGGQNILEPARPAPAEIAPPPRPADSTVPAEPAKTVTAPRRRSRLGLPRKRTVESPPAEHSGEHPISPAGKFSAADTDETSTARPRLAAEMITDTSRDVIVAGKKPAKPSDDDTTTTPARSRKKSPKSDS